MAIDEEGQLRKIHDGLYFEGGISLYTDVNNSAIFNLARRGDDFFVGYYIWVVWDGGGAGAAPQGERRLITGYVSNTGLFTHDAFSAPLALGDKVIVVHPSIAQGDLMESTYQLAAGELVQVPFYVTMETIVNDVIEVFAFDALGATIREVFINIYLPLHGTATFTPTWEKTRADDLITFTTELIPVRAAIATPAANAVYSYKLGEIAQGLQGRFRLAQSDHGALVEIDAFAVVLMEL